MKKVNHYYPGFLLKLILPFFISLAVYSNALAKNFSLEPGFKAKECEDIFKLNMAFLDTTKGEQFLNFLDGYTFYYRTESLGLDNVADIWLRQDSTVVLMLRGTTAQTNSIMADFYCAMVPATGTIRLRQNKSFTYQLANDPRAAVHAGFLI